MDDATADVNVHAEQVLLTRLRVAVWATVGIAVVAIVGAVAALVFQYMQVTRLANPGSAGLVKTVKVDDFVRQLADAPSLPGSGGGKYLEEAKQIVNCSRESNAKSGLDTAAFTPQLAEVFRLELQRVAQSQREERGAAYVADAVRFFCAVLSQPAVIAYKKNNSEEQLFDAVINYHLTQWDQLKDEARRFRQDEQLRNLNAILQDELRTVKAQSGTLAALCIAGVSLGLLMVAALYFVLSRMEFKLQGLQRAVEALSAKAEEVVMSNSVSDVSSPSPRSSQIDASTADTPETTV